MKKYIFLLYDLHLTLIGLVLIYVGIKNNALAETLTMRGCLECYAGGIFLVVGIAEQGSDIHKFFIKK